MPYSIQINQERVYLPSALIWYQLSFKIFFKLSPWLSLTPFFNLLHPASHKILLPLITPPQSHPPSLSNMKTHISFITRTTPIWLLHPISSPNQTILLGTVPSWPHCQDKVGFIDGTLTCPTDALQSSWIICNSIVIAWILNLQRKLQPVFG